MKQRIVPFVDHEIGFRLLKKLVFFARQGSIEIPAVITTRDNSSAWWPSIGRLCLEEGLSLHIYEDTPAADFAGLRPHWFLLLSWKHLMPSGVTKNATKGTLNLHYSLLPKFRGVYPVNWSLISGCNVTGFTYHFINDKIDGGEIFMQVEVPILPTDTARSLQLRIDDVVCDYFDQFIGRLLGSRFDKFERKTIQEIPAVNTYYSRRKFEDACALDLDANHLGGDFLNLLRGLTFSPEAKNAYYRDKTTGRKIYVSIELRED